MIAGRSLKQWVGILARGIRRGVLLEYLACTLFGSYRTIREDARYSYLRSRRGVVFAIPKTFSARARADYLYTMDPLTELSIHSFFTMKRGVFVDIGAFVGKYALEIASNPGCTVLAIEPNPESAALLAKNAALNRCTERLTVAPYAITARPRSVRMSVSGSTSRVVRSGGQGKTVTVRGLPLLTVLKRYTIKPSDVMLLKVDVEGEQLAILEQILRSGRFARARIICEILADASRARTLNLVATCGYYAEPLDDSNYLIARV